MKKYIFYFLTFVILSTGFISYAQDEEKLNKESIKTLYKEVNTAQSKKNKEGWTKHGQVMITFNQSNFSNWAQGGSDNIALNTSLKYFLTYDQNGKIWDTRLWAAYGFTHIQNDEFEKKTQDILELNSIYGLHISKNLFYSIFMNFRTQFAKGYKYSKVNEIVQRTENSRFMSPGSFKIGFGILWKKVDFLKINFSPITTDIIIVNSKYVLPNGKYYGVKEGEVLRLELGANLEVYSKLELIKNVSVEQIFTLYANYLENFGSLDLYYRLGVVMKINKFLSTDLNFESIYNDNIFAGLQTRQVLGVGLSYDF